MSWSCWLIAIGYRSPLLVACTTVPPASVPGCRQQQFCALQNAPAAKEPIAPAADK